MQYNRCILLVRDPPIFRLKVFMWYFWPFQELCFMVVWLCAYTLKWFQRKCSKCASVNGFKKLSKFCQHFPSSWVYMRSGLSCPGLGVPAGGCYQGYLTAWHWWLEGGSPSLPVSFASLQYLSFRMNAALLGCLCLVKTPFLLPATQINPADTRGSNKKPD